LPAEQRVIINADDLGFAPGVNRGILEAYDAGTLSSASMMVNTPAFLEAAALVRDRAPALGVGLHFNLVGGQPLAAVPTLADPRTGSFHSLAELSRRALIGRISPDDVRRECDAQLALLRREGITPSHLDSHRHSHALPGVLAPVLASVRAANIRFVRRPLDQPMLDDPVASAKMLALHASWRVALRGVSAADRANIEHAPHFRGIALQGVPDVELRLLSLLDRLPGDGRATEIMLHPGYDDPVLAGLDPYRHEREREVRALCSAAVRQRVGMLRLISFRDLA
jgi:predicted glycoside hydrolase/deacetylase ChbG (UPF0249 family)